MEEDQNFPKVKINFLIIILSLIFISNSYSEKIVLEKLVELDSPWGSSFINNNEIIVTEKSGKIKIVDISSKEIQEVSHELNFVVHGQGGLLDIIHKDNIVWISYTEDRGNYKTSTSIARLKLNKKKLNFKNIFQANPPIDSGYHFGSRLAIKDNSSNGKIVIEDKCNPEKNISNEYQSNEIFKASDAMVDSLTQLLYRERTRKN